MENSLSPSFEHPSKRAHSEAQIEQESLLVQQVLSGNQRAMKKMYQMYAPYLFKRIQRMLHDSHRVDDCLQQVFLIAIRKLSSYRGDGSLLGWLNRITTNVVLDEFRAKKRFHNFFEDFRNVLLLRPSETPNIPDIAFFDEERRQFIQKALQELSPKKRMLLLLCDFEGFTIKEAAEELEIAPGTAASRLFHARSDLKKKLERMLQKDAVSVEEWLHVGK